MQTHTRFTQTSVTIFIQHQDKMLFLRRALTKRFDPGKINGIGGRSELYENASEAAVRETIEETGYSITEKDLHFAGTFHLYETKNTTEDPDWHIFLFTCKVDTHVVPIGMQTEDGELVWMNKEEILKEKHLLVADLEACIEDLFAGKKYIASGRLDGEEFKDFKKLYI